MLDMFVEDALASGLTEPKGFLVGASGQAGTATPSIEHRPASAFTRAYM